MDFYRRRNLRLHFLLLVVLVVATASRLPAPVIEEEEKAKPTATVQPEKPKPKHKSKPKSEESSGSSSAAAAATPRHSGSARNLTGPTPQYPPGASALSGKGVYLLHFDTNTGAVTEVTITQSTGSALLDQTCIAAFSQWHEDPNGPKEVPMTMTFKGPAAAE
jgi:TonB family protein